MAFNVNDYIKPSSKPFVNRIVDPMISTAMVGQPNSSKSIATSATTNMLVSVGASQDNIKYISNDSTVNVNSEVSDEYYALSGSNIARATRASLINSRFGRMSTREYLTSSDPATRIRTARNTDDVQILVMV